MAKPQPTTHVITALPALPPPNLNFMRFCGNFGKIVCWSAPTYMENSGSAPTDFALQIKLIKLPLIN